MLSMVWATQIAHNHGQHRGHDTTGLWVMRYSGNVSAEKLPALVRINSRFAKMQRCKPEKYHTSSVELKANESNAVCVETGEHIGSTVSVRTRPSPTH